MSFFATRDSLAMGEILDENFEWNQVKGFAGGGQYVGTIAVFEKVFDKFGTDWLQWKATITRYIVTGAGVFAGAFTKELIKQPVSM